MFSCRYDCLCKSSLNGVIERNHRQTMLLTRVYLNMHHNRYSVLKVAINQSLQLCVPFSAMIEDAVTDWDKVRVIVRN